MELIKVKGVSYRYPDTSSGVTGKVSFSIEKGSYTAILGANGSGKSTLARLLCGFITPDEGEVVYESDTSSTGKAPVGIVFQDPKSQIIAGIVHKDTELGPKNLNCPPEVILQRVDHVLELTELSKKKESSINALSLGQTQKLALSGILAMEPEVLILDEAVSMIDPETRGEILDYISRYNKTGRTVITITHDISEALLADHILAMDDGNLAFDGTVSQFQADSGILEKIFGTQGSDAGHQLKPGTDTEPGLILKDINFSYGTTKVLDNLSASFGKGLITAVTGRSGSGKSTLFEITTGLLSPETGSVFSTSRPVLALQDCSAAIFEEYAADDVAYGPINQGVTGKKLKERVRNAMNLAGLPFDAFSERRSAMLSGGEKRKLAVAGIIAMDSDVMIFDEPCAGLDPLGRKHLLETFKKLRDEGKTIIFSTHRQEEADFADVHMKLENGRLTVQGEAENLPAHEAEDAQKTVPAGMTDFKVLDTSILLNNLRKTTAGLYEKGTAPIYRLSPALKYLVFLAFFIPGTVVRNIWFSLAMVPFAILYAALTGLPVMKAARNVLRLIPWLLIFSILQLFLQKPGADSTILFKAGIISLSSDKLLLFARSLLHLTCGVFCMYGFLHSISEMEAAEGFQKLVPSKTAALVVIVLFRFIPLLAEEAALIMKVQLIRGGLKQKKGFFGNLKALLPIFVPLFVRTIQRADNMAEALTARYF